METFLIYITFIMTIGYGIIKVELNLQEIKFVFGLPATKFFLTQILKTLASFNVLNSLLVVLMIVFNFIVMIIVIGFMFMTLRNIRMCLHYLLDDPLHRHVRAQIHFRRCKLLVCHTFIGLFYLFQFFETSTLSLSFFLTPVAEDGN